MPHFNRSSLFVTLPVYAYLEWKLRKLIVSYIKYDHIYVLCLLCIHLPTPPPPPKHSRKHHTIVDHWDRSKTLLNYQHKDIVKSNLIEPVHEISYNVVCVTGKK